MNDIEKIDQLLVDVQTAQLSSILPQILALTLQFKDYEGYALLAHWNCSLSEFQAANAVQRDEILKNIMLLGVSREKAQEIEITAAENYIAMKTIKDNEMLSHSAKEIEDWFEQYDSVKNTVQSATGIKELEQRKRQLKQQYDLLRSVIVSKLTNFRQRLIMNRNHIAEDKEETKLNFSKVFVVHGHNGEMKEAVARLVEKQGIKAIILHEQANQGDTIIEKFERNSDVGGAVCLFTADDLGRAKADIEDKQRARQNVVFEAGYFIGKIGRKNVILIADKGVEIPSDLQGVVYTESSNWRFSVLQELKAMGYNIDYNLID